MSFCRFLSGLAGLIASGCVLAQAGGADAGVRPAVPEAATPWALRYVIKVDVPYFFDIRSTRGKKRLSHADPSRYQELEAIAPRTKTYVVENSRLEREEVFATLVLDFDRQGKVLNRLDWSGQVSGRMGPDGSVYLLGDGDGEFRFDIGEWQQAQGSKARAYSPALCTAEDATRYQEGFSPTSVVGNFGCREWAYYLQNRKLPYIDVTSYQTTQDRSAKPDRRGRYPSRTVAVIRPLIGWGRFDIAPKPVIGRHGDSWFCLKDCPDGDLPGYIPNMKNWVARNGWPMPKPPRRLPMFAGSS